MTLQLTEIAEQIRNGNVNDARQALEAAPTTEETAADRLFLQGLLLEQESDWSSAIDAYDQALEADPDHLEAMFHLAVLEDRLGDEDRAMSLYEDCVSREQAPVHALINLALLYEEHNLLDEAKQCLESVLEQNPNHVRARQFLKSVLSSYNMYYDEKMQRDREIRNAILDIPVTDFELSVRSRNCLKQMNIRALGDLLKITEAELLSYKNFGETSLNEIKAMLTQKGLRLGQAVQGAQVEQAAPAAAPAPTPEVANHLMRPVTDLELSVRSRRCLQRLGIATIGDLVRRSEAELMSMKNFGQTSLSEIKRQLAQLGMALPKTPHGYPQMPQQPQ
jgi:DNA-directed RNA polymerase subunit alpha